jgi:hypothetical protein
LAAQVLRFGGSELDGVRAAADEFAIPALTGWQRRILTTAFKLVGYPYIWGGTSDSARFVHSSGRGVALERLAGWYQSRFAWARRPLVEARLLSGS